MRVRLQKILSQSGIASRRGAEQLIVEGRVAVNGRVITQLGTKVDPDHDRVRVDGKLIKSFPERVYLMLYKPPGYVSTLNDPEGRPVVTDLVDNVGTRIFLVGRLDYDAEGLLLLTNDGELAHRLQHPRYQVVRTYEVKVKGVPSDEELGRLKKGMKLEDGLTLPANVSFLKRAVKNTWLRITIAEGRNRQVKRMCAAIGYPVVKLRRIGFGPLTLGRLGKGESRFLTREEVGKLYNLVGLKTDTV